MAIEVTDNFQSYSSGLFKDTTCHNTVDYLNHAVILVNIKASELAGFTK